MPWTPKDATKHTKKADTPSKKKQWTAVANNVLKKGESEGSAIRQANAVVKRRKRIKKSWGDYLK